MELRCLIVDDSRPFLEAARNLLEREGLSVVRVASNGDDAVQMAEQCNVALVDIELGEESGFDLARRLADETSLTPSNLILISTHAEEDFQDLIEASRVAGFLAKSHLSLKAIREIVRGSDGGDPANRP
jgi:DNA-binding NarL/FixJ family response regulator